MLYYAREKVYWYTDIISIFSTPSIYWVNTFYWSVRKHTEVGKNVRWNVGIEVVFKGTFYRISKNKKSWRSPIYKQITRSIDDDSRNPPLKYFCLKCQTYLMRKNKNTILHLEFIAHWALIFLALMSCKTCYLFFTIFLWPGWPVYLKLLKVFQFTHVCMHIVDYIKCVQYTASKCFVSKINFVMFL